MARLRSKFHAERCPATGSVITCNLNGITGNLHARILSRWIIVVIRPVLDHRRRFWDPRSRTAGRRKKERVKEKRIVCTYIAVFSAVDDRESSIIGGIKRKAIIGQDVADVMSWWGIARSKVVSWARKKDRNSRQGGKRWGRGGGCRSGRLRPCRSPPNRSGGQNEGARANGGREQKGLGGEGQEEKETGDSLESNKLAKVEVTLKLLHG